MNIAEKLIQLRNEKGLTQAQLGRELNIALSSIQNYENIKKPRIPEATLLLKISKYFDVDMEYLLDDNLNNRRHDNIVIEKELGLDDASISIIKSISEDNSLKISLNSFLSNTQIFNIITNYHVVSNFIILLTLFNEIYEEICYDSDKNLFYIYKLKGNMLPKVILKGEKSNYFDKKYITDDDIYKYLDKFNLLVRYSYFELSEEILSPYEFTIISEREMMILDSMFSEAKKMLNTKRYSSLDICLKQINEALEKIENELCNYSELISYKMTKNILDMLEEFNKIFDNYELEEFWNDIVKNKDKILNKKIEVSKYKKGDNNVSKRDSKE